MTDWGAPCVTCGHPATYHGKTFCMVDAGGPHKKRCDCDGYSATRQQTVTRDQIVGLMNQSEHAPMSDHDPRDGSCVSCPWPLHALGPEAIADAFMALLAAPKSAPEEMPTLRKVLEAYFPGQVEEVM